MFQESSRNNNVQRGSARHEQGSEINEEPGTTQLLHMLYNSKGQQLSRRECEVSLECGLQILHEAREVAVAGRVKAEARNVEGGANRSLMGYQQPHKQYRLLDDTEMDRAVAWLKDKHKAEYIQHTRTSAQPMRGALHSAFRTYLKEMLGDVNVAYSICRNWYESRAGLLQLVQEILNAKDISSKERAKSTPPHTKASYPTLAQEAFEARRDFTRGEKIVRAVDKGTWVYESLSEKDKELHSEYHRGLLKQKERKQLKKHGAMDSPFEKPLSIEKRARTNIEFDRIVNQPACSHL